MKKFAEYITEGAPKGKKPKEVVGIEEQRLQQIDEVLMGALKAFGGAIKSGEVTVPQLSKMARTTKPTAQLRAGRRRQRVRRLAQQAGVGLRKGVRSIGSGIKTGIKTGLRDMIVDRTVSAISRRLDRAFDPSGLRTNRERPYTQMMGSEKLQTGSVGSTRADAERRRRELGL